MFRPIHRGYALVVEYQTSLTYTAEVYQEAAAQLQMTRMKPDEQNVANRPLVIVICIAVPLSLLLLINEYPWILDYALPVGCLILGFIMGVVFSVLYTVQLNRAAIQMQKPVELTYVFRDHAFEITQPMAHAIYSWEAIKNIVQGDKYWLMLLKNNENMFHPLDARAMSQELKDFLVRKVMGRREELA